MARPTRTLSRRFLPTAFWVWAPIFTTTYNGTSYSDSFIDSGSNALYFLDLGNIECTDFAGFYCPASTLTFNVTNSGMNGTSAPFSFSIANTDLLFQNDFAAYNNLGVQSGQPPRPSGLTSASHSSSAKTCLWASPELLCRTAPAPRTDTGRIDSSKAGWRRTPASWSRAGPLAGSRCPVPAEGHRRPAGPAFGVGAPSTFCT